MTLRELKDNFDVPINLGDALLYAVKHSSSVSQQYAFIYGIEQRDRGTSYVLKVVACKRDYIWKERKMGLDFYKTTLSARNFTKIDMSAIPQNIKDELLKRLP